MFCMQTVGMPGIYGLRSRELDPNHSVIRSLAILVLFLMVHPQSLMSLVAHTRVGRMKSALAPQSEMLAYIPHGQAVKDL